MNQHGSTYTNPYARQAAQQYRSTQVTTADPAALVVMMYDGAVRFIRQGIAAIEKDDFEGANANIGRAQDIVAELINALNMDTGEIADSLYRMYEYMQNRLVEGNVRKDPTPLNEVIDLLQELRDTWDQIARGEGGASIGADERV